MNIEEAELKELLEKQKNSIECKRFPIEALLGLLGFLISAVLGQILMQQLWIKLLFWGGLFLYFSYLIYLIIRFFKSRYSEIELIKDIKNSDRVRNFSLVVLKDKSGIFKDSFLLRYDRCWKCFLLPYLQTHDDNDEEFVMNYVKDVLELVNAEVVSIKYDDIEKFSVSDKVTKKYHHTFYHIKFDAALSKGMKKRTVKLNGEKFCWFTIDQMKRNKSIEEKNSETINFIARNF